MQSYIYTEEQTDELDARIAHCVRAAADIGEEKAANDCHWKGVYALDDGAVKEAVTGVVVACLDKRAVATRAVTQVRECLEEAMARDV